MWLTVVSTAIAFVAAVASAAVFAAVTLTMAPAALALVSVAFSVVGPYGAAIFRADVADRFVAGSVPGNIYSKTIENSILVRPTFSL